MARLSPVDESGAVGHMRGRCHHAPLAATASLLMPHIARPTLAASSHWTRTIHRMQIVCVFSTSLRRGRLSGGVAFGAAACLRPTVGRVLCFGVRCARRAKSNGKKCHLQCRARGARQRSLCIRRPCRIMHRMMLLSPLVGRRMWGRGL